MTLCTFTLDDVAIEVHVDFRDAAVAMASKFAPSSTASTIEKLSSFVSFCSTESPDIAIAAFEHIHKTYCLSDNIHVVVQQFNLSQDQARTVIKGYYSVWNELESRGTLLQVHRPALFTKDGVNLVAMFGGQGGTNSYLDEGAWMLDVYRPILERFVIEMSDFVEGVSCDERLAAVYTHPLDVLGWMTAPESRPSAKYLTLTPVSIITVAIAQLMHLMVLYKTLRLSPGELSQSFKGAIGHCQGLVFATLFASLTDEQSFYDASKKALGQLMVAAARNQLCTPSYALGGDTIAEFASHEGKPSPMVAVRGMPKSMIETFITKCNQRSTLPDDKVYLAIINGYNNFVVTGRTTAVIQFVKMVRAGSVLPGEDQSRVHSAQRKPVVTMSFLNINLVGHCELLQVSADWVYPVVVDEGWTFDASSLGIAIYTGTDLCDLRAEPDTTRAIVDMLCVNQIDWPSMVNSANATHFVDFSPGGFGVFSRLTHSVVEGKGITIISASSLAADPKSQFGSKADLFKHDMADVFSAPSWQRDYALQLARIVRGGEICIDSPLAHALGLPPVTVAGIPPLALDKQLVAAVSNAGYHVELCGSTAFRNKEFGDSVRSVSAQLIPGRGFAVSIDYANQRHWQIQYPELLRMRGDGIPITGLGVNGSIPPVDAGCTIIRDLRECGIRHVAFKPESARDIRQVMKIAANSARFPVIIQWTGVCGGNQSASSELLQPILETYREIRTLPNVFIMVGLGSNSAKDALPYFSGEWSCSFGSAHMPIDGVVVSPYREVDDTEAMPNSDMSCPSAQSAQTIKKLDELVFSHPEDSWTDLTLVHRDTIIALLSSYSARPWFAQKSDGRAVDLQDMTYMEVIDRLVELMYTRYQSRWQDFSHRNLLGEFLRRVEDRFSESTRPRIIQRYYLLNDPAGYTGKIVKKFPDVTSTYLLAEDADYLVDLCKQAGRKPVPFVPTLDEYLRVWLLNEDDSATWDSSSGVICESWRKLVQGGESLAALRTMSQNDVQELVGGVCRAVADQVSQIRYGGDVSAIPSVEYIGPDIAWSPLSPSVESTSHQSSITYTLPAEESLLPNADAWLEVLAGSKKSWLRALLTAPVIAKGTRFVENAVRRIMQPLPGQAATISLSDDNTPTQLDVYGQNGAIAVSISIDPSLVITVSIPHRIFDSTFDIQLLYKFEPTTSVSPIIMVTDGHNERIQSIMQSALSLGADIPDSSNLEISAVATPVKCEPYAVTEGLVRQLCSSIPNMPSYYVQNAHGTQLAPMDILFYVTWPGFASIQMTPLFDDGALDNIHLYNRFSLSEGARQLHVGDIVDSDIRVVSIENTDIGRKVTLVSRLYRDGSQFATIESAVVSRNIYADYSHTFKLVDEPLARVTFITAADAAVLESKEWFVSLCSPTDARLAAGQTLEFSLKSVYHYKSDKIYSSIQTTGPVNVVKPDGLRIHIADIDYIGIDVSGNPVTEYLKQVATRVDEETLFDHDGFPVCMEDSTCNSVADAPSDNWKYAHVSGDYNIIHTNPYVANYVGLPGQICHGMWTSASTRALVERFAANGDANRVRSYYADFVGMVLPGDRLDTKLFHVGMRRGLMLIEGKTFNQHGDIVLTCSAEIGQPKTAYVFTGQGAQFIGMGMELYNMSAVAQDVWDRADGHMRASYGVSLLEIVRNNPKQLLVKFGGKKGAQIRSNYLALTRTSAGVTTQLVPGITPKSSLYVHRSANGLLNATLFTQPIQTVMSLAQVADMRSRGIVQAGALFAGHSLGEIGSLSAIAEILSVEAAVDIALYRGLLLHASVDRDNQGCSQYAMVSVNPKIIGNGFGESTLQEIVCQIRRHRQELLEVINYNVKGIQYVVTGHTDSLEAMTRVIDTIVAEQVPCGDSDSTSSIAAVVQTILAAPVVGAKLRNGTGTTAVPGVDVPSHSSQLSSSVDAFRNVLLQKIPETPDLHERLCGHYIPNMIGTPFALSRDYIQGVYDICKSDILKTVLDTWDGARNVGRESLSHLAHVLLVELLAFQFASSVRWINTQNTLFKKAGVSRVVEIGPSGSLGRMASQTLTPEYGVRHEPAILHAGADMDKVYYLGNPKIADSSEADDASERNLADVKIDMPHVSTNSPVEVTRVDNPRPSAAAQLIDDVPLQVTHILLSVVGQKLRKSVLDILPSKSIKELVAGKSTLQNEIVGIIQKEFGRSLADNIAEKPLQDIAGSLGTIKSSLGKHSTTSIQRLFSAKIPSVLSQAKAREYLKSTYGLGRARQDAVLMMATTLEPAKRLEDEDAAKAWLDEATQVYAKLADVSLTAASGYSESGATGYVSAVVDSRELESLKRSQNSLARSQMQLLAESIGVDLREGERVADELTAKLSEQAKEINHVRRDIGEEFIKKAQPLFSPLKARRYNSFWNWARQDALQWIYSILTGEDDPSEEVVAKRLHMLRNRSTSGLLKMLESITAMLAGSADRVSMKALETAELMLTVCKAGLDADPVYLELSRSMQPCTYISQKGEVAYSEIPRDGEHGIADYVRNVQKNTSLGKPSVYLFGRKYEDHWSYSKELTALFFDELESIASEGLTFEGKVALVTGCGKNSIGSGLVEGLLSGGAMVIATTSSYNMKSIRFFEEMYRKFGARGSELVLVPFNQASVQDSEELIEFIYSKEGLGVDLDFILPFAAFPEHGKDMTSVDSSSELTIRILLTNLHRMFGQIKVAKIKYDHTVVPTMIVLPHSPNQGLVGDDGMYGETKAALHTLYNRWHTESWSDYLSITGGDIGWTRSTNMTFGSGNAYADMERVGWRTFSREEMAFNVLGLLTPTMVELAHSSPVYGSFNGGAMRDYRIRKIHEGIRTEIAAQSAERKAILSALSEDEFVELQEDGGSFTHLRYTDPLAMHRSNSPVVKSYERLSHLRHLEGMVDLDKVVVVTGFGEVGPFGNSALRWEREAFGEFSIEGCIELAWIMGLIKHVSGKHPTTGESYVGWVDSETLEPVRDIDIKSNYEERILAHTGIRVINKELCESGSPYQKNFVSELQIDHDLEPFETTEDEAGNYKRSHGKRADVWANADGSWSVKLLKGALLLVPKAMKFDRYVAAQLPTGWDPVRLGLPQNLVEQMDPVNIYAVVATVEALVRSGITDPYEIYQYLHVSEVGHSVGSCLGGGKSLLDIFRTRWADKAINTETLLEATINTTSAWINVLLLSASGPLKPTVGACATAAMALDIAVESIMSGKAKMMVAGAVDGYAQDSAYELAAMSATANADDELAHGRFPSEMCRPCTSTRGGFTEGYGSGIAVLMSASAAIEMGAPIYGIVALTTTATDKSIRNFTAPGQGILTMGRENHQSGNSPLLDFGFRRQMFNEQIAPIQRLEADGKRMGKEIPQEELQHLRKVVQNTWSNEFYRNNPSISPVRGALAVWGLGPDDIDMASFHGTSTTLNDKNESELINKLMRQLGRTPGLPVPVVCQKWLTGHPKAVAAQFMMNGLLQAMNLGIIPGNENADSIDNEFEQYDYLVYPSRSYRVPTIKAALLTTFGLSQASGGSLVIHPDYLFATLTKDELEAYREKNSIRCSKSHRYMLDTLAGKHPFIQVKEEPPYTPEQESQVYLDSLARAKYDLKTKTYHY